MRRCSRIHRSCLFADADPIEGVQTERADLEVLYVLAHRLKHRRVCDRCHRHLLLDYLLGFFVEPCALGNISGGLGGLDQLVVVGVTPLGEVVAFQRVAAKQGAEPVVRGQGSDCAVISGSEGVRQGDVLGPLLFCIGLKPALERSRAIFAEQHPQLTAHIFAYMDDVTIVGSEPACVAMFRILKIELEEGLSLMVNNDKTVTTSSNVGATMGCEVSTCPKLIGAFVGRSSEEEKTKLAPPSKNTKLRFLGSHPKLPSV